MRRVVFAATADQQLVKRRGWWRKHRDKAPNLFDEELAATCLDLAGQADAFPVHSGRRSRIIRRCLLPKTRTHLFFVVDEQKDEVTILAVWGAVRKSGPPLR